MKPEHSQQSYLIFQAALDLAPEERSAYLDQACAGDIELRREIQSLISSYEQSSGFIETPAIEVDAAIIAAPLMNSIVGQLIGHYRIVKPLGAGGMGEVYLASDLRTDRKVALKLLPDQLTKNDDRVRRFQQEARTALTLNHPNIVTIYEIGEADRRLFIASEWIQGETLRQHMAYRSLPLSEALDIAIQVAGALTEAHQAGIVHRDIKPENIMLRPDGYVKVLDFGIAKLTELPTPAIASEAPTALKVKTAPGMVMGTAQYMSPEQARGLVVDPRTDTWSLGVVLYEMVAGCVPFAGETSGDVIAGILEKQPAPLARYSREAPEALEEIVTTALAKNREERYQTATQMMSAFRRLKQRLEVAAELERSTPPHTGGIDAATGSGQETAAGVIANAAAHTVQPTSVHQASSAEFIVGEIKRHKKGTLVVLAVLVVVIAGFASYFVRSGKASINSVAVLPFVNVTKDADMEYLSDGISESLINNLSQLPQLKVIARTSTFKYKGREVEPEEVAKALGVQAIVTGRITQRGEDLQISVELVNALDKTQMWGEQYNRRATDLQAVQAEIARTISEKLRLRLTGAQEQRLTKRATENPQAYELYLTGLFYQRKGSMENAKKALDYYNQAVALDPNFALAFARMPPNYLNLALFSALDPKEALAKGKAAAQKALELDETLADAHYGLAAIRQFEWDWSGAESEYKRANELDPNNAGAHGNYAIYLSNMGRMTEALVENKRAQELDPLTIRYKVIEAGILVWARRYDESIPALQNDIKLQPDFANAHLFLGFAYEATGMYTEAINEYQKAISIDGETTSYLIYLGHAYAMAGKRDDALAILNKLKTTKEYVSPAELAVLYAGLGDKEAAFQALERAYSAHDLQMQYLKVFPHYDVLRSDPRFTDLMRRVGLTQ